MKITFYERSCSGCAKARSFLTKHNVEYDSLDVRKKPISIKDTLKITKKLKTVYGVTGKKITSFNLNSDQPSNEDLKKILIGRSGTLRAPCLQVDNIFIGGFDPALYSKILDL